MLNQGNAIATIAVKDAAIAKKFYEGTLGLEPLPASEKGVLSYKSGNSQLLVYQSQFAGTRPGNRCTAFSKS